MRWTWMALGLVACSSGTSPESDTDVTTPTPTPEPTPTPVPTTQKSEVVQLQTRDEVTLEADFYDAGVDGSPAFVLLHMIPPGNDRTNWPTDFMELLVDNGWSALAVDRRGAGGSDGVASEAYTGPNGKFDVEAAVSFLSDRGATDLVLIGASNGTTSLLDYAVWAGGEGLPEPVAVGFMTGGNYTENQNAMKTLPQIPAVFTYSTAESAWSDAQKPLDPGSWSFLEYANGSHGTRMFGDKPDVRTDLVDFFSGVLDAPE
ncbi:MAG: alpha/beta hydrolase [Myxococcales bacterium]|nr:alpha/beta hydrolase [Myxococcales bacterium]